MKQSLTGTGVRNFNVPIPFSSPFLRLPFSSLVNIGTNNLADAHARPNTPTEIAQGIEEICSQIQRHHPDTQIILMAIFPRDQKPGTSHRKQITAINKLIQPLGKKENIHFLDITDQFLNDKGEITKELMADYLHPTAKGYALWAKALKKEISP